MASKAVAGRTAKSAQLDEKDTGKILEDGPVVEVSDDR